MARSMDQVVEVIPLMDGEDSPRRVLCPWRVHPAASTLPAVARATAGRFVRCEYLIGRDVGVPRGPASGFWVGCSPVRDSLENGLVPRRAWTPTRRRRCRVAGPRAGVRAGQLAGRGGQLPPRPVSCTL